MSKADKFTRCFGDFVKYLNVVEPFDRQDGVLDARVGIASDQSGDLCFWMQDCVVAPDEDDRLRFHRIELRVVSLLCDLNSCRTFVDDKIEHTFDLCDQDGKLRFEAVRRA